jgi:hypothetical protein
VSEKPTSRLGELGLLGVGCGSPGPKEGAQSRRDGPIVAWHEVLEQPHPKRAVP